MTRDDEWSGTVAISELNERSREIFG